MIADSNSGKRLRSHRWFGDPADPAMTAPYLERYMNYGITPDELRGGKPIIGVVQTGSNLSPRNGHHIELTARVRDAGGVPLEFPIHMVGQLGTGACLEPATLYLNVIETRGESRNNH